MKCKTHNIETISVQNQAVCTKCVYNNRRRLPYLYQLIKERLAKKAKGK